jgi:hypothetical protein
MATAGKIILGMLKGAGKLIKGVLGLAGGSLKLTAAFDVWGVYKLTGTDPPQWTLDVFSDAEDTLKGLKDYLLKIKSDPSLILEQTAQEISDTADHKGAYGIGEVGFDIALAVLPGVGAAAKGVKAADKVGDAAKIAKAVSVGDKASVIKYLKANGVIVVNGKIGGKIPVDELSKLYKDSIHNLDSEYMICGKYNEGGVSYIEEAGKKDNKFMYFDLDAKWNQLKVKYNLTDKEIYEYINKYALYEAARNKKTFVFSHNPVNASGTLGEEWKYIKELCHLSDNDIIKKGGYWYVK